MKEQHSNVYMTRVTAVLHRLICQRCTLFMTKGVTVYSLITLSV